MQSNTGFTKSSRGGVFKREKGAEDEVIGSYKETIDRVMRESVAGLRTLPYYARAKNENKKLIATRIYTIFNEY